VNLNVCDDDLWFLMCSYVFLCDNILRWQRFFFSVNICDDDVLFYLVAV
jgi:hypothetical protein